MHHPSPHTAVNGNGNGNGRGAILPSFLACDLEDNTLSLDDVVLNEFHTLKKFHVSNLLDAPLRVKLSSDLGKQVGFQLCNENLEAGGDDPHRGTFLSDDFNQLFNTVNLVHEVSLAPRERRPLVVTFHPAPHDPGKDSQEPTTSISSYEVTGKLLLKAIVADSSGEDGAPSPKPYPGGAGEDPSPPPPAGEGAPAPHPWGGGESRSVLAVQFRATVSRSILKPDVTELVFDDCVPGGHYVKDFSIWNRCDRSCQYLLHQWGAGAAGEGAGGPVRGGPGGGGGGGIEVTDYEAQLPLQGGVIPPCSHARVRVKFRPREVGEFDYPLVLENLSDPSNSITVLVHCIVSSEHKEEGLVVSCGGEIDFGDCYAGHPTVRRLVVRNITQEVLHVNLGADMHGGTNCEGDKASFYIVEDDDAGGKGGEGGKGGGEPPGGGMRSGGGGDAGGGGHSSEPRERDRKDIVEEVVLGRGEQKAIDVYYKPFFSSDPAKQSVVLEERSFRMALRCASEGGQPRGRYSKTLGARAKVCYSLVRAGQELLDLGDCNVGSTRSYSFDLHNLSELPAVVTVDINSAILSCPLQGQRVTIAPHSSINLDLDFAPVRVNAEYQNHVNVENLYNKRNTQHVEVRSNNMDRHHVLFHSLFYKLVTPTLTNALLFDNVVINSPTLRPFSVRNITKAPLVLSFASSATGELSVVRLGRGGDAGGRRGPRGAAGGDGEGDGGGEGAAGPVARPHLDKEGLLEMLEMSHPRLKEEAMPEKDKHAGGEAHEGRGPTLDKSQSGKHLNHNSKLRAGGDAPGSSDAAGAGAGAGGGSHGHDASSKPAAASSKPRKAPAERLEALLREEGAAGDKFSTAMSLSDPEAEKRYVALRSQMREEVVLARESRALVKVERLELGAGEEKKLFVLLHLDPAGHPSIQGRLRKQSAKVKIGLLEYDPSVLSSLEEPLAIDPSQDLLLRELPVSFKCCRSLMHIAQRSLNFGHLVTSEHRARMLVLTNSSDVPLFYKVQKTGSIASGDLHIIDGRVGMLRPHCSRECNFVFQPSFAGEYLETLTIANVQDPTNDQGIAIKAQIVKAENFEVKQDSLAFGPCLAGAWSPGQRLTVTNHSKHAREFVIRGVAAEAGSECTLFFKLERPLVGGGQGAAAQREERAEALNHKLRIAERKGNVEKADKLRKKLRELEVVEEPEEDADAGSGWVGALAEGQLVFVVKSGFSQHVQVKLRPEPETREPPPPGHEVAAGLIAVYEMRNEDVVKDATWTAEVFSDEKEWLACLEDLHAKELSPTRAGPAAREAWGGSPPLSSPRSPAAPGAATAAPSPALASAAPGAPCADRPSSPIVGGDAGEAGEAGERGATGDSAWGLGKLKVGSGSAADEDTEAKESTGSVKDVFSKLVQGVESAWALAVGGDAYKKSAKQELFKPLEGAAAAARKSDDSSDGHPPRSATPPPPPAVASPAENGILAEGKHARPPKPLPLAVAVEMLVGAEEVALEEMDVTEVLTGEVGLTNPNPYRVGYWAVAAAGRGGGGGGKGEEGGGKGDEAGGGGEARAEDPHAVPPSPGGLMPPSLALPGAKGTPGPDAAGRARGAQDGPAPGVLEVGEPRGTLGPGESVVLRLACRPAAPGKHAFCVSVFARDADSIDMDARSPEEVFEALPPAASVSVLACAREVRAVSFPQLGGAGGHSTVDELTLSIGPVVLDAMPSAPDGTVRKVVPLQIQGLLAQPLRLTFKSNLAKQVYVCSDEAGEQPLAGGVDVPTEGGGAITVYVCLQANRHSSAYEGGICREVIAGVRVKALARTGVVLEQLLLKFTSILGLAAMTVRTGGASNRIELGRVTALGAQVTRGALKISNGSSHLPLRFRVRSPSGRVQVSMGGQPKASGTLCGRELAEGAEGEQSHSEGGKLPAPSRAVSSSRALMASMHMQSACDATACQASLDVTLTATRFGLVQDELIVENLDCPGDTVVVPVDLFVDDCSMGLELGGEGAWQGDTATPVLSLGNVYLTYRKPAGEGGEGVSPPSPQAGMLVPVAVEAGGGEEGPAAIVITSRRAGLRIVPASDLGGLYIHPDSDPRDAWLGPGEAMAAPAAHTSRQCGPPVAVPAGGSIAMRACFHEAPLLGLSEMQVARVLSGRRSAAKGRVLFHVEGAAPGKGRVVAMFNVHGSFCVSTGELVRDHFDAGKVGYANAWKDVEVPVEIRNKSHVPLRYRMGPLPAALVLSEGHPGGAGVVAAGETASVVLLLRPRVLDGPECPPAGPLSWGVSVINELNPENAMELRVAAELTAPALRYQYPQEGRMTLPPIQIPRPPEAAKTGEYFTVSNTSDETVSMTLDMQLEPVG